MALWIAGAAIALQAGAQAPAAQPLALTVAERAWIAAHPTIRLASDPTWAPIDFLDAHGEHQGMTADYVRLLNQRLGLSMRWSQASMPWTEVLQAAQEQRIDVVPTAGKTAEREAFLAYAEPPYVSFRSVIVVRADLPFVSGMQDLRRHVVALVPGYAETADFEQRYPGQRTVRSASVDDALIKVASGQADATVGNLAVVNWVIRTKALTNLRIAALYTERERTVHFAVRKDWPELAGILEKGLASITPEEHARIQQRWYDVQVQKGIDPVTVWRSSLLALLSVGVVLTVILLWTRRLRREIAERRRAQAALEQAQQQLIAAEARIRQITESLPGVVYELHTDLNGAMRYLYCTDGAFKVWGVTREQALADARNVNDRIEPDDFIRMHGEFAASLNDSRSFSTDFRLNDPATGQRWLRSTITPRRVADGVVWTGHTLDVTAERTASELVREAERRLKEVTDSLPGMVYQFRMDPRLMQTAFTMVSDGVERLYGVRREDVLREQNLVNGRIAKEDLAKLTMAYVKSVHTNTPMQIDFRAQGADGQLRWHRTFATPQKVDDGAAVWNGFTMDITAEREIEEREQAAQKKLRDVTESLPGAVFEMLFDDRGELTLPFVSAGVLELAGIAREAIEADKQVLLDVIEPADVPGLLAAMRQARDSDAPLQYDCRFRHRQTGEQRWLRVALSAPRTSPAGQRWRSGFWQDITDIKRLQAELAEARDVADRANRAKGEFLANMSHEIRTPMNAVIGLTQLALKTALDGRQRDYLQKIDGAARSLLDIINDILDFSKIEAGKLTLEQTHFDLNDVLDNLAGLMSLKAADKGLELLFAVDPAVPHALLGDPLRLGQVLINLAGNAVKFTHQGQVVVRVAPVSRGGGRCRLRFEVVDSGIGMTAGERTRLFAPFTQADASTTRRYGGTGLGLSISRRLVDLMGGELRVDSEPGQGSRFWFEIDCGISELAPEAALVAPDDLSRLRVLVVDDNAIARDILATYLRSFGFRVEVADSGAAALACIEAQGDDRFGLVLMDWQLPGGMSGIAAAQRIQSGQRPPPVVIMVSAYGREDIVREAERLGLDAFLVKPVNPSVLFDAIMHAFGHDEALTRPRRHDDGREAAGLRGLRVLLVEDNEVNQQVARELLESAGVVVDIAADGREAVARAPGGAYDAVLMDLQMPVMDGFEATRVLRTLPACAELPIIAMTANAMAGDRERCLAAGMNDHIPKPVDMHVLYAALRRVRRGERALGADVPAAAAGREATGLNLSLALRRLGGNRELYRKLAVGFLDSMGDVVTRIDGALAAGRADEALRLAHTLKSLAANVGAEALASVAGQAERALRQAPDEFAAVAPALAAEHARTAALVRQQLGDGAMPAVIAPQDPAEAQAMLATLYRQLGEDDAGAVAQFDSLHAGTRSGALAQVGKLIAAYDFDGARRELVVAARALGVQLGEEA